MGLLQYLTMDLPITGITPASGAVSLGLRLMRLGSEFFFRFRTICIRK